MRTNTHTRTHARTHQLPHWYYCLTDTCSWLVWQAQYFNP